MCACVCVFGEVQMFEGADGQAYVYGCVCVDGERQVSVINLLRFIFL